MKTALVSLFVASSLCAGVVFAGDLSGRRAPGFALPDANYDHFYDLQDYRGKVVLIDIMSTTCPHCMLLSTTLEDVQKKFGSKLQILSVVLPPDNQETIRKYIATHKITTPIVCDQGQMTISYFNAKPGQAHIDVPHLFLIDQKGMIRKDWAYNDQNREIFEGSKLIPEIQQLLK
jgi:peroxiredoxin